MKVSKQLKTADKRRKQGASGVTLLEAYCLWSRNETTRYGALCEELRPDTVEIAAERGPTDTGAGRSKEFEGAPVAIGAE